MFDRTRRDLVQRLDELMDRYEQILIDAQKWQDQSEQATGLGLRVDEPDSLIFEIQTKVNEQLGHCGESITLLTRDRAFPLFFKGAVKRAEQLAEQCELALLGFADAETAGKEAFQQRFGTGK